MGFAPAEGFALVGSGDAGDPRRVDDRHLVPILDVGVARDYHFLAVAHVDGDAGVSQVGNGGDELLGRQRRNNPTGGTAGHRDGAAQTDHQC